jgi:hypothetical protein
MWKADSSIISMDGEMSIHTTSDPVGDALRQCRIEKPRIQDIEMASNHIMKAMDHLPE